LVSILGAQVSSLNTHFNCYLIFLAVQKTFGD
jgi:hypothetical protein